MMKHIGRHNNEKVILVFRQLPAPTEHMALVLHTSKLPADYHDSIMKVLESAAGQQARDFADALHRNLFPDGRNMLNVLHHNGWLKKVQTSQVIVEPNAKSHVRLDEINKIINEMDQGAEAAQRLKDLDSQSGLQTRNRNPQPEQPMISPRDLAAEAMIDNSVSTDPIPVADPLQAPSDGILSDVDIARNTLQQADQMEAQMKSLEAEATRLREEAYDMAPSLKPKRGRGRSKKGEGKKVA